ncbi:MAG: hypothetical protein HY287_16390 [Planctomycetes bacterium]|nr:hypothetical protein [Planctomycetota bacterium]
MLSNRSGCFSILALVSAVAVCGCSTSKRRQVDETEPRENGESSVADSGHPAPAQEAPPSGRLKSPEWEAIQDALRRQHYRLDRVDETAGVITTMPEVSQHWFEFWRKDVATFRDFLEASFDPLRRWIEVSVTRDDGGKCQTFYVVVHKERLSAPDRKFNNSTAVYQFFAESLPSTTGAQKVTLQDNRWIELGRDGAMENYLGRKLAARTGLGVTPSSPQ